MPRFQITPVKSLVPAAVSSFRSSKTNDGSEALGQSLMRVGQQFGQIAEKMIVAQTANEISDAHLKSTTQLTALKLDLEKKGLKVVNRDFDKSAKKIFQDITDGMSPNAKNQFTRTFNNQYAQTRTSAAAAALKRDNDITYANSIKILNQYNIQASDALTTREGKANAEEGFRLGNTVIETLRSSGIIDASAAEKLRIKHNGKFASNAIKGWINSNAGSMSKLKNAQRQIGDQKFDNPDALVYWNQLEEPEKQAIRQSVTKEIRDLTAILEKKDEQDEQDRKNAGVRLQLKIHELIAAGKTEEAGITLDLLTGLIKLSGDDYATVAEVKTMGELIRQGTNFGTTEPTTFRVMASRVSLGTTSEKEIFNTNGLRYEDRIKLVGQLYAAQDKSYSDAVKLFEHPEISMKGSTGGRFDRRMRSAEQLTLESQLYDKFIQARQKKESFDAITEARKMRDDFLKNKGEDQKSELKEFKDYLATNKIDSVEELNAYLKDMEKDKTFTSVTATRYRRLAREIDLPLKAK